MSATEEPGPDEGAIAREEVLQGLLYAHTRSNLNTVETQQARAGLDALLELLIERGVVDRGEFETRRAAADQRLREAFVERGMAVALHDGAESKYAFEGGVEIDCAARLPLCQAACCRLVFALSKEDVEEGAVRWDLGQPYVIARKGGCCVHLERASQACGVYAQRPTPCRAYDCRRDERIWQDFEQRIPNPRVGERDWPQPA